MLQNHACEAPRYCGVGILRRQCLVSSQYQGSQVIRRPRQTVLSPRFARPFQRVFPIFLTALGIDYTFNVPPQDVLANAKRCQVDAGLMKSIGINSIRVYGVDVKNDHSSCMNTFESQGIYVWIDMSTPDHAMNRVH